ncbi:MAG TPA: hypothetical protein VFW78_10925 [Bacteroidia bacterium]|nr:hypothetical protein [Bacteroidia bacterium]
MKIDIIYIPCYRRDFRLARICIASIRHWYPDIPITIIKDEMMHSFDTTELERVFNVSVYPQNARLYGWGFSKFEAMFEPAGKRFLFLDADIVMAGPVLELLEKYDDDYIVHEEPYSLEDVYKYYFNLEELKKFDPAFHFPEFTFNTGQFVGTAGKLKRSDFDPLVEWSEPRIVKRTDVFTFGGEQPVLNYVVMKKMGEGMLSVKRLNFMREGLNPDTAAISIDRLDRKEGYPFILHWHDKKPDVFDPRMRQIPRNDILLHFEKIYFEKASIGVFRRKLRIQWEHLYDTVLMKSLLLIRGQIGFRGLFRKI